MDRGRTGRHGVNRTVIADDLELEGFYVKDALVNRRLCVPCPHHIGVCANGAGSSGWAHLPDRNESRVGPWLETTHAMRFSIECDRTNLQLYGNDYPTRPRCRRHRRG